MPYLILVLAIWMASFTGIWADGTRPDAELSSVKEACDPDLRPVPHISGITVGKFRPEKGLY